MGGSFGQTSSLVVDLPDLRRGVQRLNNLGRIVNLKTGKRTEGFLDGDPAAEVRRTAWVEGSTEARKERRQRIRSEQGTGLRLNNLPNGDDPLSVKKGCCGRARLKIIRWGHR